MRRRKLLAQTVLLQVVRNAGLILEHLGLILLRLSRLVNGLKLGVPSQKMLLATWVLLAEKLVRAMPKLKLQSAASHLNRESVKYLKYFITNVFLRRFQLLDTRESELRVVKSKLQP
ncbi:hypothetical protein BER92_07830 [Xanthomonas fragariae]|nr:hypothetical protein BER92_07830 [Xanthomonas fragariae]